MLNIEFSSQSKKFLKKSDKELADRIIVRISLLREYPIPHNSVKVIGELRTFRIRVGDYRILYEINLDDKVILVSKIDKRSRVYN